ncbi:MAG: DUF5818 domain-containing protein [Phycisphaerae bacterium]
MMRIRWTLGATLAIGLVGSAALAQDNPAFDSCGTLIHGAECVLFRSDAGPAYVLETHGDFDVGDRVHVVGTLDESCVSTCMQGAGCIQQNTIEACADTRFRACGKLVQGTECVLFETHDGQRYSLENQGDFQVDDRVFVAGTLDPDCASTCQEGDGCILDNSIHPCHPGGPGDGHGGGPGGPGGGPGGGHGGAPCGVNIVISGAATLMALAITRIRRRRPR